MKKNKEAEKKEQKTKRKPVKSSYFDIFKKKSRDS